jgi:polar amino acid transport system permease protein
LLDFLVFAREALPDMLSGTVITIKLTFGAIVFGFLMGLPLSILRTYGPKWLQPLLTAYINIYRGTPLLVQLFVIYYGLPDLGITFDRMTAAYLTLALNSSAYQAEYFRGGFQAVSKGQMIAARAIGMSRAKAILHIILPQALRLAVPAWTNEFISMVKYTAVVFLIAVPDLMNKAKMISSQQFAPIQSYLLAAVIYLVLVGICSAIMRYADKRLAIPGLNIHPEGH